MTAPIAFACRCGAVTGTVARAPDFVHDCNCSFCAPRDAYWGYFQPAEVTVAGETVPGVRADREPMAEMHRCPGCDTTTHFVLTEAARQLHGNVVLGVNMKLADPAALAGVELRHPDGKAFTGSGEIAYVKPHGTIGAD